MKVQIHNTIYCVVAKKGKEVCTLQEFEYTDGINRQLKIWTDNYKIIKEEDDNCYG